MEFPTYCYNPDMIFFTREGLHIARTDIQNEDILQFDIFKIDYVK